MPKTTKTTKSKKVKGRKKRGNSKPSKSRPPRIFIKKGKLYVRVGKKNFLLKDQQDYTKRELIDIILKELVVRRRSRKRGTVTKRERKKDKDEMKVFQEFEQLNRNQSKHLKLPTNYNQKSQAAQSVFTGLIRAFDKLPGDVNLETRALMKKDADDLKKTQLVKSKSKSKSKAKSKRKKLKPLSTFSTLASTSSLASMIGSPTSLPPLTTPLKPTSTSTPIQMLPPPSRSKKISKLNSQYKSDILEEINRFGYVKAKKKFKEEMGDIGGPEVKTKSKDELTDLVFNYYQGNNALNDLDRFIQRQQLFNKPPPTSTTPPETPPPLESEDEPTEADILQSEFEPESDAQSDAPSNVTAARQAVIDMSANGKFYTGKGLRTSEIDNMMGDIPGFIGTFPANFYKFLPKNLPKKFGFVMNLDKSDKPGSHWVAVYVDTKDDMSIEYYDSFAMPPTKGFMKQIKRVVDKLNPNVYLKFKVNGIVDQKTTTSNCGWHCMNFLLKRFMDKPFKTVTKYDAVNGENEVQTLKQKFGYI